MSTTLTLGWKPETAEASPTPRPKRKHQKPHNATVTGSWWGVVSVWRKDPYHGPIFRHPTRETAESEADYLSELNPGVLYVVIEAVSWRRIEKPPGNEPSRAE